MPHKKSGSIDAFIDYMSVILPVKSKIIGSNSREKVLKTILNSCIFRAFVLYLYAYKWAYQRLIPNRVQNEINCDILTKGRAEK